MFFRQLGWVSFDATPASERPSVPRNTSLFAQRRSLYQALETKHLEYIVDYDGKKLWQAPMGLRRPSTRLSQRHLSIALGLLGGAAPLFSLKRRGLRRRGDAHKTERAQARLLAKLQRRGFEVLAQENAISRSRHAHNTEHGEHMSLPGAIKRSEALRFFSPEPLTRRVVPRFSA